VDNEMKGALFPNDKGDNPSRPDWRGSVVINGVKYSLSGWDNTSKKGDPYKGLIVSEWREKKEDEPSAAEPDDEKTDTELLDEIPF
jgi:uncharacterized protein (DUF736 family)